VIVRTTEEYTLETDITSSNYQLLRQKYGEVYGWTNLSLEDLQSDWRKRKSDVMLRICHDLVEGELDGFVMPPHIREIIDFMQKESDEG
jgi:putative ATP-dependent endonuclease of the OLD family